MQSKVHQTNSYIQQPFLPWKYSSLYTCSYTPLTVLTLQQIHTRQKRLQIPSLAFPRKAQNNWKRSVDPYYNGRKGRNPAHPSERPESIPDPLETTAHTPPFSSPDTQCSADMAFQIPPPWRVGTCMPAPRSDGGRRWAPLQQRGTFACMEPLLWKIGPRAQLWKRLQGRSRCSLRLF